MNNSLHVKEVPVGKILRFESPKLKPWHFERRAVIYVRQSTHQQVKENRESTQRQYALVDRAVALGWTKGGSP